MLKALVTPLLFLLCASSGGYYYVLHQASQPVPSHTLVQQASSRGAGQVQPQAQPTTEPLPPSKLPDVDAVLVIDNSGSMFGYTCRNNDPRPANDREQLRIRGADIIIGALAADLKPRETKLGIITFGDDVTVVRRLTQLSNEDPSIRSDLSAAIQNPPCQGDTNIVAALRAAQAELRSERATPGNIPAIIFLTDGIPTAGGGTDVLSRLLTDLGDIELFMVVLGSDAELDRFKAFWQTEDERQPNITFYAINASSEIPELYKKIAARLNQVPDFNKPILPPGQRVEVPVPANVQQMVLTVLKRTPSVPLTIQDAGGNDARTLPPDRFRALISGSPVEVFVIDRPEPGAWQISVSDDEVVTVLQPEFKSVYQVQLLQPDARNLLQVDQPTDLVVQVVDSGTQTVLDGDFKLTGTYRRKEQPEGEARLLVLQPGGATGQYTVQIPPGTFADAEEYIFSFSVEDQAGLRSQPSIYALPSGRMPMIVSLVAAPASVYVDQPINLIAKVANQDSASGQPTLQMVQMPQGVMVPSFTSSGADTYQATVPAVGRPGSYTLSVGYSGKIASGRDFSSTRSVSVVIMERPLTVWLRRIALLIATLLGAFLIFRFVLLSPLIPVFQKLGISPQGYVRVTPPGQTFPNGEEEVRRLLQRRRRLRRLTVGVGSGFDIPLDPDPSQPVDPDAPPPRPSLRERLWGKPAAGQVRRKRGSSIIESGSSSRMFSNGVSEILIEQNTVEFSLKSIDNPDGDDD